MFRSKRACNDVFHVRVDESLKLVESVPARTGHMTHYRSPSPSPLHTGNPKPPIQDDNWCRQVESLTDTPLFPLIVANSEAMRVGLHCLIYEPPAKRRSR